MTWVRIDEGFYQHPKVVQAGPLALAMQVAALCYCNRNLTDGFIPEGAVPLLLNLRGVGMEMDEREDGLAYGIEARWEYIANQLLEAGMWSAEANGYRVHDFTDYQPSKEQVAAERAQRQAAGQAGGQASAKARAQAKLNPVPVPVPVPVPDTNSVSSTTTSSSRANAIKLYEEIFGRSPANKTVLDSLLAFEETRPEGCIRHCLQAAAGAEASDWRYAKRILTRHEEENCDGSDTHPANNGRKANGRRIDEPVPTGSIADEWEAMARTRPGG